MNKETVDALHPAARMNQSLEALDFIIQNIKKKDENSKKFIELNRRINIFINAELKKLNN